MIRRGSFKPHSLSHGLLILALLALVGLPAAAGASDAAASGAAASGATSPGALDTTFDPGTGADVVLAMALQPDGKVLVGGQFAQFNDIPHNGIVRLAADGSLDDAYNPSVTGGDYAGVTSIARQPDGKAIIGGAFTEVNGEPRAGIARLKTDGALDTEFDPGAGIADKYEYLNVVKLQTDGKILIGGAFTAFDGAWCGGIARLTTTGALDPAFDPGSGTDGEVLAIAVQPADGKILIGGAFTTVGDEEHYGIARLNTDGSVDGAFTAGVDGGVMAITVQQDGRILIGGAFTEVNGAPRHQVARLLADGTLDPEFNPAAGGAGVTKWPTAMELQPDGKVVIGGKFETMNGVARKRIARLMPDGALDAGFDPGSGANYTVYAVALQPDGRVLIGGAFDTVADVSRRGIARLWGDPRIYLPLISHH